MRASSLAPAPAALMLLLLTLLAGCAGSGPGPAIGEGDGQPEHMPRQALFADMVKLDPVGDKTWMDAYGMTENPGEASPNSFSTSSGLVPAYAYVALYAADGDRERIFTAATMRYATPADAQQYMDEHGECRSPTPMRSILADGRDVTILVAGLDLQGDDPELRAALEAAEDDVRRRTGATLEC